MKKITIFFSAFLLFCFSALQAQITIGKNQAPQSYSVLELVAQYKSGEYGGFRLPQLTTAQRDALGVTAADTECEGLMIFNLTTKCVETWNGTKWISTCADSGGGSGGDGYNGPGFPPVTDKYVDITVANNGNPTVLRFMTYNLGADPDLTPKQQMQVSGADPANMRVCGGFYQWGRKDAKHTFRGDPISPESDDRFTKTLVPNIGQPNAKVLSDHGKFVYDECRWTTPDENNSDLWGNGLPIASGGNNPQKGANDPCPSGWRVPTQHEWELLIGSGMCHFGGNFVTFTNSGLYWVRIGDGYPVSDSHFNSYGPLAMRGYAIYEQSAWEGAAAGYKDGTLALTESAAPEPLLFLPAAGTRNYNGYRLYIDLFGFDYQGRYWSSSVERDILSITRDYAAAYALNICHGDGLSVRCIAE